VHKPQHPREVDRDDAVRVRKERKGPVYLALQQKAMESGEG
jgi:hypothetical protein